MNVEEEIEAAVYCLRKDFGNEINEELIREVVASIRRKHREATIRSITGFLSRVGNGFYRLLTHPQTLITRQP